VAGHQHLTVPPSCYVALLSLTLAAGCAGPRSAETVTTRPALAPASQPAIANALQLETGGLQPLHREMLPIDLEAAIQVARADNLDIQRARQVVEASRGRLQSSVGGAFPAVAPTAAFEHVDGTIRAVQGNLVGAAFNTFQPAIAAQWITNPGQVVYDIIAARRRLSATKQQEQAVVLDTLRQTAGGYYELVLAQARVATARQAVREAEELLRITQLRVRTGTGVPADELRADARLSERQQDLVASIDGFYRASVSLALTLHLDSSVTLIPSVAQLPPVTLVRAEVSLEELLDFAVVYRPDLQSVRELVKVAAAARGATWWGALGPQFQVNYQFGGITGHSDHTKPAQGIPNNLILNPASPTGAFSTNPLVNGAIRETILRGSRRAAGNGDQTFGFSDQARFNAVAGWRFSISAFGDLKTASAAEQQIAIEAEQQLDRVRAEVILAREASKTNAELARLSQRQVASAEEALRLTQRNLQAGTMTTLDVLEAENALTQARLRNAEAVVRYNQAQVDLIASIGLLNEEVFEAVTGVASSRPTTSPE
jgi:outer membrane protein TolC